MYFPLHPETPLEGRSLADLFRGRSPAQAESFHNQMKTMMEAEGLPYGKRSMTYNSRLSQELGAWADTQPNGDVLHGHLYRAYFVDNLNIGDIEVLMSLVDAASMDVDAAREVLVERHFKDKVDGDWRRAADFGITGVPSFVSRDLCVVGCQPYETLMRFVNHLRELHAQD